MSDTKINWYSIGLNQKVEEHQPVDLKDAVEIVDKYLSHAGQKFKDDKEAIAASMFGFSKSKSDFIELCVNDPKQLSYKFEFSTSGKFLRPVFQHEEELNSREQIVQKVTEFFTSSSEQMAHKYKSEKNQRRRSPLGNPPDASIGVRIFTVIFGLILGLFGTYSALNGISGGKISWPSKSQADHLVHRDGQPLAFWILVMVYSIFSIWLIRACLLETKVIQKMLSDRKKAK